MRTIARFARTPKAQSRRKKSGSRYEELAYHLIRSDSRMRGWKVQKVGALGQPGLDLFLHPPGSCAHRDVAGCKPPQRIEVKSVEKIFEPAPDDPWPKNRLSRFVLKPSEADDPKPSCYVLIYKDELTGHVSMDVVDSARIIKFIRDNKASKAPKLSVRAIPFLRKTPCKLVSKTHHIVRGG